jgi:hypothetical protein
MEWKVGHLTQYRCKKLDGKDGPVFVNEEVGSGWYAKPWADSPKDRYYGKRVVTGKSRAKMCAWLTKRGYEVA